MKKQRRKGFTLIELLVTIVIVSLITVVTVVSVNKIIDISNDKKNKISINNIQTSARTYVEEFDKEWVETTDDDLTEFTCTTVGMLINKGFLKENLIGTTLNVKTNEDNEEGTKEITLHKNTSIMVKRNTDTKVLLSEDLYFDSEVCNNLFEVNIRFKVEGDKIKEDGPWYTSDVVVTPVISGKISDETLPKYNLTKEGVILDDGYEESSDKKITISTEGKKINFCMQVVDKKTDQEKEFCLAEKDENGIVNEENLLYIDKKEPDAGSIILDDNYNLLANTASDDLTNNDDIKYYLTYDTELKTTTGKASVTLDESTRVTNKQLELFVEDEAGHRSKTITKTLNITDSQTEDITSDTKYYCSLDSTVAYNTESEATANCDKSEIGTVTSKTVYKCSLNSSAEYDTESEAAENCSTTTTGTVTSDTFYYCSLNTTKYTSRTTASNNCTEQGDTTTVYSCDSGTLNGSKCYEESSATQKTMYGLTCAAGTTTTYGWSSTGTTSGLTSCSSSTASCSKSSHVGNTKTSCSSYEEHTKTYSTDDECAKYAPSNCSCDVHDGEGYYVMCPRYKKTTYTCKESTSTSTTKTYTGTSGSGSTSGGCPSGTTATLDDSESTCDGYIGDTCSSSCSSCCGDYKYYTCTSSSNADKEYYCKEDGETYSSASSCEKTGSVTSDKEYYCSLDDDTYSSENAATNACNKTTTGTVSNTTNYFCSLDTNTYTSQTTANNNCNKINIGTVSDKTTYTCSLSNTSSTNEQAQKDNCTDYCEIGTYSEAKNACYSLN